MDAAVLLAVCLKGGVLGAALGCLAGVRRGIRRDRKGRAKEQDGSQSGLPLGLLQPEPATRAERPEPGPEWRPGGSAEEVGVPMRLCDKEFVNLLKRLVSEARHLQNNPVAGVTPTESRAVTLIRDELDCFAGQDGPLAVEEIAYAHGRANLKVTYRGQGSGTVAFVGAHLDTTWQPSGPTGQGSRFRLRRSSDELRGAGAGAGLGHAALLVQLLCALAREQPKLNRSVVVVFFAARVAGEDGVGADALLSDKPALDGRRGPRLDELKSGPVFWLDDVRGDGLCRGSMGSLSWTLESGVRTCSSGPGFRSVDSISLASDALTFVQRELQKTFLEIVEQERQHGFETGSAMSPAQISCVEGASGQTTIHGQILLTPFLKPKAVMETVDGLVEQFEKERRRSGGEATGLSPHQGDSWVDLRWGDKIEGGTVGTVSTRRDREGNHPLLPDILEGVQMPPIRIRRCSDAPDLSSDVSASMEPSAQRLLERVLRDECSDQTSELEIFCANGCIPHLRHAQREGFDVQLCGFGPTDGDVDCCSMRRMHRGFEILRQIIFLQEKQDLDSRRCSSERDSAELQDPAGQGLAEQRPAEQAEPEDPTRSPVDEGPPIGRIDFSDAGPPMVRGRSQSDGPRWSGGVSPSEERRRASSPIAPRGSRRSASWNDGSGRFNWTGSSPDGVAACRPRTPDWKDSPEPDAVTATPDQAIKSDEASVLETGRPSSRRPSPGPPDDREDPLPAQDLEFKVVIDKTTERTLGASVVFHRDNTVEIEEVHGELLQQWNDDHPELAVKRGDRIAEVNGIKAWWTQNIVLELVVKRRGLTEESPGSPPPHGASSAEGQALGEEAAWEASPRAAHREGRRAEGGTKRGSRRIGTEWLQGLFWNAPAPCMARDGDSLTPLQSPRLPPGHEVRGRAQNSLAPQQEAPRRPPEHEVNESSGHDETRRAPAPAGAGTARRLEL